MFHKIHEETHDKLIGRTMTYFNWWELIDADDTMPAGHRAREIHIFLKAIEKASAKYDMKLNYSKCNYIAVSGKAHK